MSGLLKLIERRAVVLAVWPELRGLPVTYILGHAALIEDVLADDPKAPVDEKTRKRIKEEARKFLETKES